MSQTVLSKKSGKKKKISQKKNSKLSYAVLAPTSAVLNSTSMKTINPNAVLLTTTLHAVNALKNA